MEPSINPWQSKPWWCQPWSILLTGCTLIAGTWLLTHIIWLTLLVAIPLTLWMGFFLLVWPNLMRQYYADLKTGKVSVPTPPTNRL